MSGFEFMPGGSMRPLGDAVPAPIDVNASVLDEISHSRASLAKALAQTEEPVATPRRNAVPPPPAELRPRDVVKLARARLREVEREIKRLHKLETERDELKRLIAAADNRPIAVVRTLPTRSA